MFVRVNVGDWNSSGLYFADLRAGLGGDFIRTETAQDCARGKDLEAVAETRTGSIGCNGRKLRGPQDWLSVNQDDVAADAQLGRGFSELNGLSEGGSIRHQGGRSDHAVGVSFNDGAIHTGSESKIVGIDDQPPHGRSLTG